LQLQEKLLNQSRSASAQSPDGLSFQEVLDQKSEQISAVKFSKHAASRLETRNITLSESQIERLNEGFKRASAKGIKESLMLVDQMAFIVNIPNSTVVTAMNQGEAAENVFTNIDGAVII
jgi:flagellar operon protein